MRSSAPLSTEDGSGANGGVEVGVASTKAFTCQLLVLGLLALKAAADRGRLAPPALPVATPHCRERSCSGRRSSSSGVERAADVRPPNLMIGAWVVPSLAAHGTPEQQERFLPPTLRGEDILHPPVEWPERRLADDE